MSVIHSKRMASLVVVAGLAVAACSGGGASPTVARPVGTPVVTPAAATPVPATPVAATPTAAAETPVATAETTPSASETVAPSEGATSSVVPGGAFKIGVVTDVGTVDDKNFNQFSFEGAQKGATDIGIAPPDVVVPKDASEYATDIQNFVDTGSNIIVTVGFNLGTDTLKAALANPDIWFIGVDQAPICVDETGAPDTTFACKGDAATLLPHLIALGFQEDQAGYLAGIVAASISTKHVVGAIGGINLVPAVVRYIQGYELGAKATDPTVKVKTGYVSTTDFGKAFNDPATGKTFANQFIQTNKVDVMFQVAGKTGNGVLQAACAAKILGIGVDVDQWGSLNAATDTSYNCIVTSAEKHLSLAVEDSIKAIADSSAVGGNSYFNAANDGIGLSAEQDGKSLITPDIQAKIDAALAGMKDGSIKTCPDTCGTVAP
jgi:basic membrane protein A